MSVSNWFMVFMKIICVYCQCFTKDMSKCDVLQNPEFPNAESSWYIQLPMELSCFLGLT
jgi:thioredoxin-related protein